MFAKGGFKLHKWHSNISSLENNSSENNNELTYAKQLFNNQQNCTKILGLVWDKKKDQISANVPKYQNKLVTKRNILSYIASIYDPLGFISPSHVIGKLIYRELCEEGVSWDSEVSKRLKTRFEKWAKDISCIKTEIPRSIPLNIESVTSLDLHVFGDASVLANCAAVYAVITQPNSINQGLVTSKSRISKKNLTIPRLKLVSAHMSANLVTNKKLAIQTQNVKSVTGWTDSTVVLYWLNQKGNYKQFVGNRVDKIREKDFIKWYYVPTKENPADLGSRGCLLSNIPEVERPCIVN